MQIDSKTLLCRYQYDALNRLVANTPLTQAVTQRFYMNDRLATEIQGAEQRSIMQHDDQLLAQQQRQSGTLETRLFVTDQQRSVVNVIAAARRNPLAYTPYGHRNPQNGLLSLLSFNGERPDPVTGCYLLGNGYRAFNPVLMRFNSPDSWSPFGEGGLNAYAYCVGDPVNETDMNGHSSNALLGGKFNQLPLLKMRFNNTTKKNIQTLSGDMKEIKSLNHGISSFIDNYKGQTRLNFIGHGTEKPINGYHKIIAKEGALTPDQLYESAIISGVDIEKHKTIRLLMCYSANGGSASFAQRFSDITKTIVKAFVNPVSLDPGVDRVTFMLQDQSSALRQQTDGSISYKGMKVFKTNPYTRGTKERRTFSYQPVKFYPR
ncbi:RHS repeat-associated core domain-containing protein [Pseudomonas sp. NPDC086251]|jgi:RHS repeat-associated protein|uniref:RHS repeat-associated core domain-containing protein n=1 Tax=Pseudomonas sp. NPDC086251 TaxID=3364431 RepID=UPI003837B49B